MVASSCGFTTISGNTIHGHGYDGLDVSRAHEQAYDPAVRARLWEVSQELTAGPALLNQE